MKSVKSMSNAELANSFRPNAGVVVLGRGNDVLAFRRTGTDAWQFPQGGIDPGEAPVDAMWRELREETGLSDDHLELVGEIPEWLGYEIPEEFRRKKLSRGQVQRWFFLRVDPEAIAGVEEALADLPPDEFDGWKWTTMSDLVAEVISFRQPIYRRLAEFADSLR